MGRKPSVTRTRKENEDISNIIKSFNDNLLSTLKLDIKHKNETQKKLSQAIKSNDVVICTGPAGCGKAQPLDSLILTPNGYITMGSLKVDDEVININGKPVKINGVYPQGEKEIYEIIFSDGTSTECCGEHLWLTQTYEERNFRVRVRNKDGSRIRIGDKGKVGTVRNTLEIMKTLTTGIKSQKANHSIPIVKPIEFPKQVTKISPYLLGCILGDGGITTTSLSFTTNDIEILNYLESDNKFIPEEYLINDSTTRLEILRGLMDTDGSVNKRSGTPIFYSTSKKLIDGVRFIVESFGGVATLSEKIGKYKKLNGEIKECKVIYNLHINLPNGIIPFKLNRKIDLLKNRTKFLPIRYIRKIELIGKKEAQCISIDDDDHLYLTNNCIVTHNTFLSCAQSLSELKQNDKIKKIVLVKSVTTLKTEEIGFLKGSLEEKMEPFMFSFMKNFEKIIGLDIVEKLKAEKIIEILPIAYMRGINIDNAIVIVDEVQNITIDNIRTILTRLGENSKMILLGDLKQIDQKNKYDSALKFLTDNFKNIDGIEVVEFNLDDVIRHPLIKKIEPIFDLVNDNKKKTEIKKPQMVVETVKLNWFQQIFKRFSIKKDTKK